MQVRTGSDAGVVVAVVDDIPSRRCVTAERSFLAEIGAGCHTPTGALATVSSTLIWPQASLFSEDHRQVESATDLVALGILLARSLSSEF